MAYTRVGVRLTHSIYFGAKLLSSQISAPPVSYMPSPFIFPNIPTPCPCPHHAHRGYPCPPACLHLSPALSLSPALLWAVRLCLSVLCPSTWTTARLCLSSAICPSISCLPACLPAWATCLPGSWLCLRLCPCLPSLLCLSVCLCLSGGRYRLLSQGQKRANKKRGVRVPLFRIYLCGRAVLTVPFPAKMRKVTELVCLSLFPFFCQAHGGIRDDDSTSC